MKKLLYCLILVLIGITLSPLTMIGQIKKARAVDYSNLMSDNEFVNWQALDAGGIQSFLNTKEGTRLRTFNEGGRSAAQIIAAASRANLINPIVILATIQKEESLIETNTNFDFRVNWAMGYGVCDSCSLDDPNVVRYRGFTNQIDNGAWQLKRNYSYWAGNGSEWNVGRTMIIDDTAVRFGNRSTSALFRYTPHLHGNENFANIYSSYKTFFYKAGKSKTKVIVSKNKASQEDQSVQTYNARYVTQISPATFRPGQQATIYAYLKNTGTSTWSKTGAHPVYLGNSSPQDRGSALMGGQNIRWQMLSRSVAPGRTGVFSIAVTAPLQAGVYTEKFRPVMEGVAWFGDEVTFTFNISGSSAVRKK